MTGHDDAVPTDPADDYGLGELETFHRRHAVHESDAAGVAEAALAVRDLGDVLLGDATVPEETREDLLAFGHALADGIDGTLDPEAVTSLTSAADAACTFRTEAGPDVDDPHALLDEAMEDLPTDVDVDGRDAPDEADLLDAYSRHGLTAVEETDHYAAAELLGQATFVADGGLPDDIEEGFDALADALATPELDVDMGWDTLADFMEACTEEARDGETEALDDLRAELTSVCSELGVDPGDRLVDQLDPDDVDPDRGSHDRTPDGGSPGRDHGVS